VLTLRWRETFSIFLIFLYFVTFLSQVSLWNLGYSPRGEHDSDGVTPTQDIGGIGPISNETYSDVMRDIYGMYLGNSRFVPSNIWHMVQITSNIWYIVFPDLMLWEGRSRCCPPSLGVWSGEQLFWCLPKFHDLNFLHLQLIWVFYAAQWEQKQLLWTIWSTVHTLTQASLLLFASTSIGTRHKNKISVNCASTNCYLITCISSKQCTELHTIFFPKLLGNMGLEKWKSESSLLPFQINSSLISHKVEHWKVIQHK
jgi:hypothetical protein